MSVLIDGRRLSLIERSKQGQVKPTAVVLDEICIMMIQSVMSQVNLRAVLSTEISCTDASTTGGGSATATEMLKGPDREPSPLSFQGQCGLCSQHIDTLDVQHCFKCPSLCGAVMCCIQCVADHRSRCQLHERLRPCFGERFSGPNYPLTRAIAREGLAVQRLLDQLVEGEMSGIFSPQMGSNDWMTSVMKAPSSLITGGLSAKRSRLLVGDPFEQVQEITSEAHPLCGAVISLGGYRS